jgi:hypothetical protein
MHLTMTQEHPITPPPELVQQWWDGTHGAFYEFQAVATQAARWGADQELEACCKTFEDIWNNNEDLMTLSDHLRALRAYRRPKPPSLKEQALEALKKIEDNEATYLDSSIICRALETLPDEQ